jgi:acetyltransferase-like isoleucine patch superfamily enzyme
VPKCTIFNTMSGSIHEGRNTSFGNGVIVVTGMHMDLYEASATSVNLHHVPIDGLNIKIGRDCFVGSATFILGNVTIGDKAAIGAGSVVTKNVL